MELTMTPQLIVPIAGSIVMITGFAVTIATIVYKMGQWMGAVRADLAALTQRVDTINAELTNRIDHLVTRVDKLYEIIADKVPR